MALLDQCAGFLTPIDRSAYTTPSPVLFGGTIGQHVRHSLDHFAAALTALDGATIDYDHRERGTSIETDPGAALDQITQMRGTLAGLAACDVLRAVRVRVMLSAEGEEAEIDSTLERELAFATHHAIHHNAMIAAISVEMKRPVPAGFGKAPSTLQYERTPRG
jgi:hypothetical protein